MNKPSKSTLAIQHMRQVDIARFWSKAEVKADNECWNWQASASRGGYGQFGLNRMSVKANRVAFYIVHGDTPPDKPFVCHHCDNRLCVNPNHLYAGTRQDNMDDMVKRKRQRPRRGEKHGRSVLKEADIHAIRVLYESGEFTQKQLAERFGVKRGYISLLVNRKSWTHI